MNELEGAHHTRALDRGHVDTQKDNVVIHCISRLHLSCHRIRLEWTRESEADHHLHVFTPSGVTGPVFVCTRLLVAIAV